jgi:hypothetical protein
LNQDQSRGGRIQRQRVECFDAPLSNEPMPLTKDVSDTPPLLPTLHCRSPSYHGSSLRGECLVIQGGCLNQDPVPRHAQFCHSPATHVDDD